MNHFNDEFKFFFREKNKGFDHVSTIHRNKLKKFE